MFKNNNNRKDAGGSPVVGHVVSTSSRFSMGVQPDNEYTANNCKLFDGVADTLEFPQPHTFGLGSYIEFDQEVVSVIQSGRVIGTRTGVTPWLSLSAISATNFQIELHDGNNFASRGFSVGSVLGRKKLKIVGVSTGFEFFIDDVSQGIATHPNGVFDIFAGDGILKVSGWNTSSDCSNIRAYHLKTVIGGVTKLEATFASGAHATEYDVSGNGNHGVYSTSSGLASMAVTSDTAPPHNIKNGFATTWKPLKLTVTSASYPTLSGVYTRQETLYADRWWFKKDSDPSIEILWDSGAWAVDPADIAIYAQNGTELFVEDADFGGEFVFSYGTFTVQYVLVPLNDAGSPVVTKDIDCGFVSGTKVGGFVHNDAESLFNGLSHTDLVADKSDTTSLTRTRLDTNDNVSIYIERPNTDADPILEKFLGN
jgi:hypothetical protein